MKKHLCVLFIVFCLGVMFTSCKDVPTSSNIQDTSSVQQNVLSEQEVKDILNALKANLDQVKVSLQELEVMSIFDFAFLNLTESTLLDVSLSKQIEQYEKCNYTVKKAFDDAKKHTNVNSFEISRLAMDISILYEEIYMHTDYFINELKYINEFYNCFKDYKGLKVAETEERYNALKVAYDSLRKINPDYKEYFRHSLALKNIEKLLKTYEYFDKYKESDVIRIIAAQGQYNRDLKSVTSTFLRSARTLVNFNESFIDMLSGLDEVVNSLNDRISEIEKNPSITKDSMEKIKNYSAQEKLDDDKRFSDSIKDVVIGGRTYISIPKNLFPSIYKDMSEVFVLDIMSSRSMDVSVEVEIPEFTQKINKTLNINSKLTQINFHPPLLQDAKSNFDVQWASKGNMSVTSIEKGKILVQENLDVTIKSMYDMLWCSDDGSIDYSDRIAAWSLPQSSEVREWSRKAINYLGQWGEGEALSGYQSKNTTAQLLALFESLRQDYGVRYNMSPISSYGPGVGQRIYTVDRVLNDKSGLCIETTMAMASAAEAAGFNVFIILPQNHALLAVETMPGNGEYIFIETTSLDPSIPLEDVIVNIDTIKEYINDPALSIIDLQMARERGILPMK